MQNAGVDRGSVEVDVSETDSSSSDSDENIDRNTGRNVFVMKKPYLKN